MLPPCFHHRLPNKSRFQKEHGLPSTDDPIKISLSPFKDKDYLLAPKETASQRGGALSPNSMVNLCCMLPATRSVAAHC